MISIYVRTRAEDGKRSFRKAPAVPGDGEYWIRYQQGKKQKWQRVGPFAGVLKAKTLLQRELDRQAAVPIAVSTTADVPGRLTLSEAIEHYIEHKTKTGKRPDTVRTYKHSLGLFRRVCPHMYIDQIIGDTLLDFVAWCRKRGYG